MLFSELAHAKHWLLQSPVSTFHFLSDFRKESVFQCHRWNQDVSTSLSLRFLWYFDMFNIQIKYMLLTLFIFRNSGMKNYMWGWWRGKERKNKRNFVLRICPHIQLSWRSTGATHALRAATQLLTLVLILWVPLNIWKALGYLRQLRGTCTYEPWFVGDPSLSG